MLDDYCLQYCMILPNTFYGKNNGKMPAVNLGVSLGNCRDAVIIVHHADMENL